MKKRKTNLLLLIFIVLILISISGFVYFFYFYERELVDIPASFDKCPKDSYVLPDFRNLEEKLSREQMIKDIPSRGKISLKFYHDAGNCRKWDKIYLLRGGRIEERNVESDIDLWINTDYVFGYIDTGKSICDIISEARNNRELGQSVNIKIVELYIIYKNMLEYKECLGVEV